MKATKTKNTDSTNDKVVKKNVLRRSGSWLWQHKSTIVAVPAFTIGILVLAAIGTMVDATIRESVHSQFQN